jgi:hypothetical protein
MMTANAHQDEPSVTEEAIMALDRTCERLDAVLASARAYPPKQRTPESDLDLAVVLHALSARDDARAVLALAKARISHPLITHVRTIFEARSKMIWLTKDPSRAARLFDSEPFERYRLANKYPGIKERPVWKTILADCKQAVKDDPKLLMHQPKDAKTPASRPDYMAITEALRMPEMEELLKQIEASPNDYVENYRLSSLSSHVSIVHLKDFPKRLNADGSIMLDASVSPEFGDHYVLMPIPWLLEVALLSSVAFKTDATWKPILDAFEKEHVRPVIIRHNNRAQEHG